jgi:hypothetical protein
MTGFYHNCHTWKPASVQHDCLRQSTKTVPRLHALQYHQSLARIAAVLEQVVHRELLCMQHICEPIWWHSVAVTRVRPFSDTAAFEFQPIWRVRMSYMQTHTTASTEQRTQLLTGLPQRGQPGLCAWQWFYKANCASLFMRAATPACFPLFTDAPLYPCPIKFVL